MDISYRRELNRTQLILEVAGIREKDYQIYMLEENRPEGILPIIVQGVGTKTQYKYDISGKISIRALYEKTGIQFDEICSLIIQLTETIKCLEAFMLDPDKIILEPEFIFYEKHRFLFCYYPLHTANLHQAFREFSEYLIRQVDCEDKTGICLAYELHRITTAENYCMDRALEQAYRMMGEQEKEESEAEEIFRYEDIIEEEGMGIGILREAKTPFGKLTGLFGRKRLRDTENY